VNPWATVTGGGGSRAAGSHTSLPAATVRVLHVIPSVSARHGGPTRAMRTIAQALVHAGSEVTVLSTDNDGDGRRFSREATPRWPSVDLRVLPQTTQFYTTSWRACAWMLRDVSRYDCVHVHALFSFLPVAAALVARFKGVPYIVRPLGTLARYGLRVRRPLLKSLSLALVERPLLRRASAVHCTSEAEAADVLAVCPTARVAVIPLAVEDEYFAVRRVDHAEARTVLYMSRLDPKKNLEVLIDAMARLRETQPTLRLLIAGAGSDDYVVTLRARAQRLAVEPHLQWLGHVEGEHKMAALAQASLFLLPSHSENFGIAVAEALASGLPCLVSPGVALSADIQRAGAGERCTKTRSSRAGGGALGKGSVLVGSTGLGFAYDVSAGYSGRS